MVKGEGAAKGRWRKKGECWSGARYEKSTSSQLAPFEKFDGVVMVFLCPYAKLCEYDGRVTFSH